MRYGSTGLQIVPNPALSISEDIIPYASALPNKRCLAQLDKYYSGWRFLLSPASKSSFGKKREHLLYERGYAIDNGVFAYWKKGEPFDEAAFISLLDRYAEGADWIAIPDVVGDADETARLWSIWIFKLAKYKKPLMFVAQDGCEDHDYLRIRGLTSIGYGIFVGGTTEWKLAHLENIAPICKSEGVWCHVGRVNSAKRANICEWYQASSFDGSGMSRYEHTARIVSAEVARVNTQLKLPLQFN